MHARIICQEHNDSWEQCLSCFDGMLQVESLYFTMMGAPKESCCNARYK